MSTFGPGSPDEETRIDEICRRFREEWAGGNRPRIEDSVQLVAVHLKDRVLARLLQIELSERKQRGETPSIQEYCERFTEQSSIVIQVFHTTLEHDVSFVSGSTVSMGEIAKTHILPTPSEADFQRSRRSGVGLNLRAGRHFGKYLLVEQLGVGGFGEVWMARNPDLDHVVALKILKPEKFTTTNVEMIRKEAQILARLHAKGAKVVPIYDADRDEKGRPYLVTRFIAGGPLSDKLGSGPQEVGYWCQVIAQIADTLAVVHAAGVYHRDIKPSNILVDEEGDPHLADFGLALPTSQLELAEGAGAGTLPNASPEQAAGDLKQMDGRIDVYSLGVMLYQGLTGNLPFQYKSWAELREAGQIPNRRPRPIREQNPLVPPKLADVCDRMLACNPHERPFAADVSSLLSKALKPPRQHLVKGVILAVVAGLLGAIGAWNLTPRAKNVPAPNAIQPTGRIWNTKPINEFHILTDRPELKQLDIYSHQVLAYHLTDTSDAFRNLRLSFRIRFLSPGAAVGFFVGGQQRQSGDFGIAAHQCQILFLSETSLPNGEGAFPLPGIDFRRHYCEIDPRTGYFVHETALSSMVIPAVTEGTFQLNWEDSRLTSVTWNELPLNELNDPFEISAVDKKIRSPTGACGLFVQGGGVFLSDVTVELEAK